LRALEARALEARFGRWGRRLYELARGIDDSPVRTERPSLQVSSEDTFESDLRLSELGPHIERLAEKAWEGMKREEGRVARTVVLKLKTSEFKTLTRSLTPPERPRTLRAVIELAHELTRRVELPESTRYRLVGVGLSGLVDADRYEAQLSLFEDPR